MQKRTEVSKKKPRKAAELKTKPTGASVEAFLRRIGDEGRRQDAFAVLELMKKATKAKPKMWGTAIVGFGDHRYESPSGRVVDFFLAGFAPRKDRLTIYLMGGLRSHASMLESLGRFKTGGGCLHVRRLEDVDKAVLSRLIAASVASLSGKSRRS